MSSTPCHLSAFKDRQARQPHAWHKTKSQAQCPPCQANVPGWPLRAWCAPGACIRSHAVCIGRRLEPKSRMQTCTSPASSIQSLGNAYEMQKWRAHFACLLCALRILSQMRTLPPSSNADVHTKKITKTCSHVMQQTQTNAVRRHTEHILNVV